ncbi:hypothetical protein FS827_12200 [Agrobacterium vitis]|nr:hypothetical protein [Allorhizobium ampelinum]
MSARGWAWEYPDIPLHTNASENALRAFVTKWQRISFRWCPAGTRPSCHALPADPQPYAG